MTGGTPRRDAATGSWLDGVDMPAAVRGSGRGFLILVVGGLLAPPLAMRSPVLGTVVLVGSAVLAFVVASVRQGGTRNGALHGALASIGAYLLVLPLVLLAPEGRDPVQIGLTFLAAVVLGGVAGRLEQQRTNRATHGGAR